MAINGLYIGMTVLLVAIGFSLVTGVMRQLNFAHAEWYMLGAFLTWYGVTVMHIPFIPPSSSGLNLVERWFREITEKRIGRGRFQSVPLLIKAIHDYLDNYNSNPQVFAWSAPVERILEKFAKCKEVLDSLHWRLLI